MLAARIHEDGGPEVIRVEEVPDPVAAPGEVLVRIRAASLNHLDVWVRKGLPSVPKPRILGADGAGVIEALGEGVDGLYVGQRVVLNPGLEHGDTITVIGEHRDGTHAELIAIADAQVFPLDDGLSFEVAAAFPLVYETAYRMLVTRAAVQEDEWVLIWGIGGGVATAAFEICRALGVRTIVTSSDDDKLARAVEWGADVGVNHEKADVVAAVRETTGKGVDVVLETVGEATWARSLAAVRPFGRVVVCGATSGPNPPAQLHRFWWKQLTVMGSTMGTRDDFLGAYELVRSGRAGVHVDRVYPLAEIAAAHERLEAGEQLGVVLSRMTRRSPPSGTGTAGACPAARRVCYRAVQAKRHRGQAPVGARPRPSATVRPWSRKTMSSRHCTVSRTRSSGWTSSSSASTTTQRSRASTSRSCTRSRRWAARPGR